MCKKNAKSDIKEKYKRSHAKQGGGAEKEDKKKEGGCCGDGGE